MKIFLESIQLSDYLSSTQNFLGQLHQHIVRNLQVLSSYLRYNQFTLAISTIGINLSLLALSEKVITMTSPKFHGEFFKKSWVQQTSSFLFKNVVLLTGLTTLNHLLDLQLTKTYLCVSVVSTVALQVLWKEVIAKGIDAQCKHCDMEEEDEDGVRSETEEDIPDDDTISGGISQRGSEDELNRELLSKEKDSPRDDGTTKDIHRDGKKSQQPVKKAPTVDEEEEYVGLDSDPHGAQSVLLQSALMGKKLKDLENMT